MDFSKNPSPCQTLNRMMRTWLNRPITLSSPVMLLGLTTTGTNADFSSVNFQLLQCLMEFRLSTWVRLNSENHTQKELVTLQCSSLRQLTLTVHEHLGRAHVIRSQDDCILMIVWGGEGGAYCNFKGALSQGFCRCLTQTIPKLVLANLIHSKHYLWTFKGRYNLNSQRENKPWPSISIFL